MIYTLRTAAGGQVDDDEKQLRNREINLREEELGWQRRSHKVQWWGMILSAVAIGFSVIYSGVQTRESSVQFKQTVQDNHFSQILSGLGSESAAVQASSMRLLTEYVTDSSNYTHKRKDAQEEAVVDAISTLGAFIEDKSESPTETGLGDYESPEPVILSRAMANLKILADSKSYGRNTVEIDRANLHGASLPDLKPHGSLQAIGTDFRRANLSGMDLSARPSSLTAAFFTCANLTHAQLGSSVVSRADFSGADLTGADLSHVHGLTDAQLTGATVTGTKLPADVHIPSTAAWGTDSSNCYTAVNLITGMRGGQGYSQTIPCPAPGQSLRVSDYNPPATKEELTDWSRVCKMRTSTRVDPG